MKFCWIWKNKQLMCERLFRGGHVSRSSGQYLWAENEPQSTTNKQKGTPVLQKPGVKFCHLPEEASWEHWASNETGAMLTHWFQSHEPLYETPLMFAGLLTYRIEVIINECCFKVQNGTTILKESLAVSLKGEHSFTMQSINFPPCYISKW